MEDKPNMQIVQGDKKDSSIDPNLKVILDLPLRVSVEVGRVKMTIREIISLTKGKVIELPKPVGEHVDVYVNDKLVAKAEVVETPNGKYGVRLIDIVSAKEIIQNLG